MNAAKDISVSRDEVADPEVRAANARADAVPPADPAEKKSLTRQPAAPRAAGRSTPHESARAQVAGSATYVDDIPECAARCMPRPSCPPWRTASCWASTPPRPWPCPACAP
jgi:hypothetical protein